MTTPENAYSQIEELIKRFKALPAAQRKSMNENATRQGFILPLFRALGWDTDNINEVSPEEKVSRGWVDFSFRINGVPRFFLETKKASENLGDPRWVKQSIDYAWTKSVTWALLSDFEGLRVFNAEVRVENPFQAEFLAFNLDSYLSDFERLWWLSRPETLAGRLTNEAEKWGKKMKRQPVSQHLFDDLKQWRMALYKDLTGYNMLSGADADNAVLRILNRLIFIRTAEDRQVEAPILRPLVRALKDQKRFQDLARELSKKFRELDAVYNSELFAPHFSEGLYISPTVLEEVINGLHEKNFVIYNFNAIESDVLGTAYEQYLGAVVAKIPEPEISQGQLFATDTMSVQERRQKRKSQGIYYTPTFVTKYIVKETLGKWLAEHGYNPAHPPRILDMACGSGSFLIEAFDVLDAFVADIHPPVTDVTSPHFPRSSPLESAGQAAENGGNEGGRPRQMELLTNCIYGVDKDKQAVEVARLNLLLRALHTQEKLPLLTNISNGDSLISGTPEELQAAFGEKWADKKPFLWEKEFPEVIKEGGFDLIIGNPPYIRAENMLRDERDYYINNQNFEVSYGRFDIHILFIERAIKMLKEGGRLGFIVPYAGITQNYGTALRKFILENCIIEAIVDFSEYKVFQDASVATCILILQKESDEKKRNGNLVSIIQQSTYDSGIQFQGNKLPQKIFLETSNYAFRLGLDLNILHLAEKIDGVSVPFGDICYLITGAVLHDPKTGASKERLISTQFREGLKPYIEAKELGRYVPPINTKYLDYRPSEVHRPKFPELFENEKLMIARIATEVRATLDENHIYTDHTVDLAVRKDKLRLAQSRDFKITEQEAVTAREYGLKYLLGIINSRLLTWYLQNLLGMAIEINPETARNLPIRRIDFSNPAEKAAHDEIVALVEEMLALQKERAAAESALDDRRFSLSKRIEQIDAEIDRRVYALYGLTEAEIRVVEGK